VSLSAFSGAALARMLREAAPLADPGRHRIAGSRLESASIGGPGTGEAFDLIVLDGVLTRFASPAGVVRSLWEWLEPGGVLLQHAEPRPIPALGRYLDFLASRLSERLSTNDDVSLDPAADPFLERFRLDAALTEKAGLGVPDLWLAAHPSCLGVDVEDAAWSGRDPAARAEPVGVWRYGSLGFHPLTPFPFVGAREWGAEPAWITSAWRKPPAGWSPERGRPRPS
jgi:SAM-dependent methyltransferase